MSYYFKWLKETVVPFSAGFLTALAVGIDWSGSQSQQIATQTNDVSFNCKTEP